MRVEVLKSRGDGSCFYDSVATVLRSAGYSSASVETLRKCVADTVLDEADMRATETLKQWRLLLRDAIKERNRALVHE